MKDLISFRSALYFLLAISFSLSIYKTINTTDVHHWEMIAYGVDNVLKIPSYKELYTQYGIFGSLVLAVTNLASYVDTKSLVGLFYSIIFIAYVILIYKFIQKRSDNQSAFLCALLFILVYPRIQYPWPDYLAAVLVIGAISLDYDNKIHNFFGALLVCLAMFTREVIVAYLITSVFLLIIFNLYYRNSEISNAIKFIITGIIAHTFLLFCYLYLTGSFEEYVAQTFNLSIFESNNIQSILVKNYTIINSIFRIQVFSFFIFASFLVCTISLLGAEKPRPVALIMTVFGLSGMMMSMHIPEIFRLQIYCFPGILGLVLLMQQKKWVRDKWIHSFLLGLCICFLGIGYLDKYIDAAGEELVVWGHSPNKNIGGFKIPLEASKFYENENFREMYEKSCFVNKTSDPLVEIIYPASKYFKGLPFYSPDFVKRINISGFNKCTYAVFNSPENIGCKYIGILPEGIRFLSGNKYYICENGND